MPSEGGDAEDPKTSTHIAMLRYFFNPTFVSSRDPSVSVYENVPGGLVELLREHLPYSLPLLRRLQFTRFKGGSNPASRILYSSAHPSSSESGLPPISLGNPSPKHFTAAYLDPAAGPETQMWIYSTLEDGSLPDPERAICAAQIVAVAEEVRAIGRAYDGGLSYPGAILIGSIHSTVLRAMQDSGVGVRSNSQSLGYDKWLFRVEDLPYGERSLGEEMHWSAACPEDCRIAISRNHLPRQIHTFILLPSLTIKLRDETPIAWAFLGVDGSLSSLYCEQPYRGRGLAKALASKLFTAGTQGFGDDGWCAADVSPDNESSKAVCRSLNGKLAWHLDWALLDV